jgi:FAD:protein FMN transferase
MSDEVVIEITRRAMATEFGIMLPGERRDAVEAAIDALEDLERIEAALSIYCPQSDISRINAMAGNKPVRVGIDVIEVLQRALAVSKLTAGAFDVTAGPLVEIWGFTKRRGQKPSESEIDGARQLVSSARVQIDPAEQTVMLERPGMKLNLGGIGKGFALDRLACQLKKAGLTDFLIHGGRSSVLASGADGTDAGDGWSIAIEHPLRPGTRLGTIRLVDSALATSGSGKQFFHHRGQRMGHVLDPRLGHPAGDMLAITVFNSCAADADAFSTACFVEGLAATTSHLEANSGEADSATVRWPSAAIAVIEGQRQSEVQLVQLGTAADLRFILSGSA